MGAHAAVLSKRPTREGYLALAKVVETEPALCVREARALWLHCAEAEARHNYEQLAIGAPDRFIAAHEFIVTRGARVAAVDVLANTLTPTTCDSGVLATLDYRVAARPDWRGCITGADVTDVAFQASDLSMTLRNLGYSVRPTAVSHGQTSSQRPRFRSSTV
ncbi:hypothetical protein [uncultured Jatrophihabitans sp.]|uniref:hypothetical protein n=1 Tax=uncultured Jatrophihabitans sp. TaxID=1610747 RepID=UPI0035CC03A3